MEARRRQFTGGRYSLRENVFDGDLVLVLNDETMMRGVDRDASIVIDIEDKITAIVEEDTLENRVKLTMRTLKSYIGEYSNYSSAYHNKCPRTDDQQKLYNSYIDVISVLTGKSIDSAKTGVIYTMPRHIAKWGRPLPYFMKYRKAYYGRQRLSKAPSNMNRLCWKIEKWHRDLRWKRTFKDFDYSIMVDHDLTVPDDVVKKIENIFLEYCQEMRELAIEQSRIRKYKDADVREHLTRFDAQHFTMNWDNQYRTYQARCREVCQNAKMLANVVVKLCYEKYPNKQPRFMWIVAEDGILENIRQVDPVVLPKLDSFGQYEYLGRRYSMAPVHQNEIAIDDNDLTLEDWFID